MDGPRIRVAAYVIRRRAVPELLVFDHVGMADAGTQVPAGGVEPGEELSYAVLREVAEEAGLPDATVLREVAVDERPHPETRRPRRTTFFLLRAPEDTPDAWLHRVRGDGADSRPHLRLPVRAPSAAPAAGRRAGRLAGAGRDLRTPRPRPRPGRGPRRYPRSPPYPSVPVAPVPAPRTRQCPWPLSS